MGPNKYALKSRVVDGMGVKVLPSYRYGDIYPETPMGMVVGTIALMLGLVLMALPVTIIVAKFSDEYERSKPN